MTHLLLKNPRRAVASRPLLPCRVTLSWTVEHDRRLAILYGCLTSSSKSLTICIPKVMTAWACVRLLKEALRLPSVFGDGNSFAPTDPEITPRWWAICLIWRRYLHCSAWSTNSPLEICAKAFQLTFVLRVRSQTWHPLKYARGNRGVLLNSKSLFKRQM